MAWTEPTVEDFKIRFPEFANADDGLIAMLLDEAAGDVGETWIEKDRTPGVLHLTAHLLSLSGQGVSGAGGGGAGSSGTPIKRRKVGDVETEYDTSGRTASTGTSMFASYYATPYGRRFLELMRKNFPAVLVV